MKCKLDITIVHLKLNMFCVEIQIRYDNDVFKVVINIVVKVTNILLCVTAALVINTGVSGVCHSQVYCCVWVNLPFQFI